MNSSSEENDRKHKMKAVRVAVKRTQIMAQKSVDILFNIDVTDEDRKKALADWKGIQTEINKLDVEEAQLRGTTATASADSTTEQSTEKYLDVQKHLVRIEKDIEEYMSLTRIPEMVLLARNAKLHRKQKSLKLLKVVLKSLYYLEDEREEVLARQSRLLGTCSGSQFEENVTSQQLSVLNTNTESQPKRVEPPAAQNFDEAETRTTTQLTKSQKRKARELLRLAQEQSHNDLVTNHTSVTEKMDVGSTPVDLTPTTEVEAESDMKSESVEEKLRDLDAEIDWSLFSEEAAPELYGDDFTVSDDEPVPSQKEDFNLERVLTSFSEDMKDEIEAHENRIAELGEQESVDSSVGAAAENTLHLNPNDPCGFFFSIGEEYIWVEGTVAEITMAAITVKFTQPRNSFKRFLLKKCRYVMKMTSQINDINPFPSSTSLNT